MLDAAGFHWLAAANLHNLSALSSQAVPPGAAACNYLVQDTWPLLCCLCLSHASADMASYEVLHVATVKVQLEGIPHRRLFSAFPRGFLLVRVNIVVWPCFKSINVQYGCGAAGCRVQGAGSLRGTLSQAHIVEALKQFSVCHFIRPLGERPFHSSSPAYQSEDNS